jgi:hypothetical protein
VCVVLSVLAPTEDKSYDSEDSLCEELVQVCEQFSKYHMKFLQKVSVQDYINYRGCYQLHTNFYPTSFCQGKGKVYPRTGHEGPEGESRYSCTHSLTWTLDGGGWSVPHPGCFTPWKDLVPIV